MKIGIIGAGRIGGTLGRAWAATGHDVLFGMRDPRRAAEEGIIGKVGSFAEAAEHGEGVLFAVPGSALLETARPLALAGKIVIDATNRGDAPDSPVVRALAAAFPTAHVYKAFNTLGFENFQNPTFGTERADLLFIGAPAQQEVVASLITDVGLNPVYVGDLDQSGALDAALALWFALSRRFGRHLAFRVLHDGRA